MLQIKNRGFKKIYMYGGSGLFTPIANLASRLISKEAFKRAATQVVQNAAAQVGKKSVDLGKQALTKLTSKSRDILNKHVGNLTSKSKNILTKYSTPKEEFNLNALIDGGVVRIEDYVKRI